MLYRVKRCVTVVAVKVFVVSEVSVSDGHEVSAHRRCGDVVHVVQYQVSMKTFPHGSTDSRHEAHLRDALQPSRLCGSCDDVSSVVCLILRVSELC